MCCTPEPMLRCRVSGASYGDVSHKMTPALLRCWLSWLGLRDEAAQEADLLSQHIASPICCP